MYLAFLQQNFFALPPAARTVAALKSYQKGADEFIRLTIEVAAYSNELTLAMNGTVQGQASYNEVANIVGGLFNHYYQLAKTLKTGVPASIGIPELTGKNLPDAMIRNFYIPALQRVWGNIPATLSDQLRGADVNFNLPANQFLSEVKVFERSPNLAKFILK